MRRKIIALILAVACLSSTTALAGGNDIPSTPHDNSTQEVVTNSVTTITAEAGGDSQSGEKVTIENIGVVTKTPEQIEKENNEALLKEIIEYLSGVTGGSSSDESILDDLYDGILSGDPDLDFIWDSNLELDNVGDWIIANKTIILNGVKPTLVINRNPTPFGGEDGDENPDMYEKPEESMGGGEDDEGKSDIYIPIGGTSGGTVGIGSGHIGILVGQSKLDEDLDTEQDDFGNTTPGEGSSGNEINTGDSQTGYENFTYEIKDVPYEIQINIKEWIKGDDTVVEGDGSYGDNNSTGHGKNEHIPGTDIEVTVTDNKTRYELLLKYWEELKNSGESQIVDFAKYTIYETTSVTQEAIRDAVPTNQYRWVVTGASGSSVETNTNTPYTRILFRAAGTYEVQVFNAQNITRGNQISGNQYDIWVLADGSEYDGLVLFSEKSSFNAFVSINEEPVLEEVELYEDGFTAEVTKQMVNVMQLIDENGNVRAPATDFTTERTDVVIGG